MCRCRSTVKSIVLAADGEAGAQLYLLLLRGDHEMNEVKVGKLAGLKDFRFAREDEIVEHFGTVPGYLGPVGMKKPVKVVADRTVALMSDFICGANEKDFHYTGVNWGRDLPEPEVADLRNVVEGDPSPDGKGVLAIERGIEVGHVFQLGTAYSQAMNATYLDADGKPQLMQMGCYGIGVTRILGAAIEQNFDDKGIVWPDAIAPFQLVLCPMGYDRSEQVKAETDRLYDALQRRRRGRDPRRPRPASGPDVRRLGADRRAAPRGDRRARPEGRQPGIPGPPRP
jgi:prolyl-tRNA synthetase